MNFRKALELGALLGVGFGLCIAAGIALVDLAAQVNGALAMFTFFAWLGAFVGGFIYLIDAEIDDRGPWAYRRGDRTR